MEKIINDFLKDPHLLDRYLQDVSKVYVGREEEILLLRILMELRKADEGICVYITGESGEGKSTLAKTILSTINPDAVIYYTDISPMALKNLKEINLSHKIFYFSEGDAIEDKNSLVYHIRSAISEGEIKSITATREGKAGVEENRIETKGTIFLTTNERIYKDRELDRRSIVIRLDYDFGLTQKYFEWVKNPQNFYPDYSHLIIWREIDKSIPFVKVRIPYWGIIVENFPKDKSRHKTDIKTIYRMICAITQIYQYQRQRNEDGEYIATLQDYEIVYKLSPLLMGSIDIPEKYKCIMEILTPYKENGLTKEELKGKLKEKGIDLQDETIRVYISELKRKGYIETDGKGRNLKIFPLKEISDFYILPPIDIIKEYIHKSNYKITIQANPLIDNNLQCNCPKLQKITKLQSTSPNCNSVINCNFNQLQSSSLDTQGIEPNCNFVIENMDREENMKINDKSELNSEINQNVNNLSWRDVGKIQEIKNWLEGNITKREGFLNFLKDLRKDNSKLFNGMLQELNFVANKEFKDISEIERDEDLKHYLFNIFLRIRENVCGFRGELYEYIYEKYLKTEVQNEKIISIKSSS